ncbi:sensor histidine kinase [Altericista sp. CCNU0014]|uniref:sensor histidine kinase n=1 Tax=Altericista sp. CCNU0014 TaxID=3082949 RepID=UPI0038507EF7
MLQFAAPERKTRSAKVRFCDCPHPDKTAILQERGRFAKSIGAAIMGATIHFNRFTQQAIEPVFEQFPTLTALFSALEPSMFAGAPSALTLDAALESWRVAIAAMGQLLKQTTLNPSLAELHPNRSAEICNQQGVVFCSPAPVFSDLAILAHFKTWIFTPKLQSRAFQLPPAAVSDRFDVLLPTLPILPGDPLAREQFCLIQTPQFCWVAILGQDSEGTLGLNFSFDPVTVEQIWAALQFRIERLQRPSQAASIQQWRSRFPTAAPDYRIPMLFGQALLAQSSGQSSRDRATEVCPPGKSSSPHRPSVQTQQQQATEPNPEPVAPSGAEDLPESDRDVELLKVLAHEVRTPLTTIQTLTRLLLRRSDLPKEVTQRLDAIQRECSGQIDRFGLIFRAMELTHADSQPLPTHLTPIALQELLAGNLTRWQAHAARRGLTLQVTTPKRLPEVAIRDPLLLNQVLTGLMEYLSNSLSTGSHINLKVDLAGSQLKLQLQTQPDKKPCSDNAESPMMRAVGQLLMFQPETGGVSLSLAATKHLFQALGGKLTVRQHLQGEVLTIFLPLGTERDAY